MTERRTDELDLVYRLDWPQVKKRLTSYWRGEEPERPLISVTAPNGRQPGPNKTSRSMHQIYLDFEYRLAKQEQSIARTYYAGESVPSVWPDLGPAISAACLGGRMVIGEPDIQDEFGSSWVLPIIDDWDRDLPLVHFDPGNVWWRRMMDFVRLAVQRSAGKYLVAIPDVEWCIDTCAALRGQERLCLDLYDNPDQVARLLSRIAEGRRAMMPSIYQELSRYEGGCVSTVRNWAPGPFYFLRGDFAYAINPSQLAEQFVPWIIEDARSLGTCTAFHTHSEDYDQNKTGRLAYLDVLLGIPEIKIIEWQMPASGDLEAFHRILEAGKHVMVSLPGERIADFLRHLRSNRLWIITTAASPSEADALVEEVKRLAVHS